jgi:PAS domain S-box-containing protein
MTLPDGVTPLEGRARGLIPWSTSPAAIITYRLALVATLTAAGFEAILLAVGGLVPGDHAIIGALIVGSAVATVLARMGRTQLASGTVIGTLWLCAMSAVVVHGIHAAALPVMVMATALAALWGGARLGISLVVASCLVLLLASGMLGPVFPTPAPTSEVTDLIVLIGQFVFLAALVGYLGRALNEVRDQFRVREQRLASATEQLEDSRSALAETETRYAELVRALPDTVVVFDAQGRLTDVTGATPQLFGRDAHEVVGRRLGEIGILTPGDVEASFAMLARVLAGESLPAFTMPGRHVDGSIRWVEVTSRLLAQRDGEPRVLVIMRDTTARIASEQALLVRNTLWRRASRIAQLGAWELDLTTGVLTWDEEVKRLHEVPADHVPDVERAIDFYTPEARPIVRAAVEALIASGTPFSLELPLVTATGRRVFVRAQGEAERRGEQVVKIFGIFQDITALHEATQLLRETVKLEGLGRLAGGVAHDFNNLLTAILGYAEEVQHTLPPDSPARDDVAEIRRAGERARELTQQLLAFARRQVVLPRVFDVARQLEHVRRFLMRVLGEDITLVLDVEAATGSVHMDPTQFEQLLLNLAVNARDAMPAGGTLTIRTRRARLTAAAAAARDLATKDCVLLEVQDTGAGMPPEIAVRVFEPFFTTKELGHGTGLGLATVYGVVRQAGGHIAVQSTVGRGTNFSVHLPRVDEVVPEATAPGLESVPGGSESILLVEDDDGVRTFAERVLRQAGYDVRVAGLGADAMVIAGAAEQPMQLLVTDVVMPGMSGPELSERLERSWPTLRTLFVSGYTPDRLDNARLATPAHFLPKPYGRTQLLERVRLLLDGER